MGDIICEYGVTYGEERCQFQYLWEFHFLLMPVYKGLIYSFLIFIPEIL
jgi:hypothetical protein